MMEGKGRNTIKSVTNITNNDDYFLIVTEHTEYYGWYDNDKTRFTFTRLDKKNERFFYDNQSIKNRFFGEDAWAIEVYPDHDELVDNEPQTHLWLVDKDKIPNLMKGL